MFFKCLHNYFFCFKFWRGLTKGFFMKCKYFLWLSFVVSFSLFGENKDESKKAETIKTKTLTVFNRDAEHKFPDEPFSFANLDAPKGGKLVLSTQGSFDGLNRYSIKGTHPVEVMPLLYNTLMYRSPDEPFTMYPLLAKEVEVAKDSSFIIFTLHEDAKFSDGSPVESYDVKATIETLRKDIPRYKNAYSQVESLECLDDKRARINFKKLDDGTYDSERPIVMGLVPVLPKKILEKIDIIEQTLEPIMGSGPYKVKNFEVGRFVEIERNQDYWAKDIYKGFYNFDIIRVDYYKNIQAQFQAFQAGESDIFFETNPQNWEKAYDFPAVKNGQVVKLEEEHENGVLSRYFAINMRKEKFKDIALRKAISMIYDGDSVNRRVFHEKMKVPYSTFSNTFYAHKGQAKGRELEILSEYKNQIGDRFEEITQNEYERTQTKSAKDHRNYVSKASDVLNKASYKLKNGVRYGKDGKPLEITLLLKDEKLEKIALSFKQDLKKLGITLTVQRVDSVQYENKILERDFDIIIHPLANSMSPGIEQVLYYSERTADEKGSSNYIGLKDPVANALAKCVSLAKTAEEHVASVHALDRYIMHLYCFVPIMYDNLYRAAYWKDRVDFPPYDKKAGTNVIAFGWSKKKVNG